MIRCRCGVWTDFGLLCTSCRSENVQSSEEPEEEITDPVTTGASMRPTSMEELEPTEEDED